MDIKQFNELKMTEKVAVKKDTRLADLIFGSISGFVGKLVEYPFDTIKVHLQTQPLETNPFGFRGTVNCISEIYRSHGIYGFFRGLSAPLVGSMFENSVLFISYNYFQKELRKWKNIGNRKLSIAELSFCGALSGAVVSFVLTPVELIKCQMQITNTTQNSYTIFSNIFRQKGVFGLYRGHWGTLAREVAGGAAWFGVYESVIKLLLLNSPRKRKEDLSPLSLMGAGALAGIGYNTALFPADVVKSRQQTCLNDKKTFSSIAKSLYRQEGFKGFYRGFGITVARSAPTSGVIFVTYEMLSRNLTI